MSLNTIVGPIVVSEEEIAADLLELHEIYTAHERFLKVEHEVGVGHYVTLSGALNLAEEILDRMAGRVYIRVSYGPTRATIYFRDHVHFQRTVAEVQLSAKVSELEAALADALENVARQKDRFENLKEWTESHTPRGEQACLFNLFDENNEH